MRPRAREIGIPFEGMPGSYNAITDVPGVQVGFCTLIKESERGAVRTGVTAIRPRGKKSESCFAAWYSLNGCGEMTGTTWIEESGLLSGPIMLTNTFSVGIVYQATLEWLLESMKIPFGLPVVTETYDGFLNDDHGFHLQTRHVKHALDNVLDGPLPEGNVGGGTGMICYDFKGGTGTASRQICLGERTFTLGALVQANHGSRHQLTIAGVPVGREITDLMPERPSLAEQSKQSSIVVILATDVPLLPHQLKRLVRRVPIGLGRTGAISSYSSGDIFLAFSTVELPEFDQYGFRMIETINDWRLDPLFEGVAQVVEEAIINALCAAETMIGKGGLKVHALPLERVKDIMKKYCR